MSPSRLVIVLAALFPATALAQEATATTPMPEPVAPAATLRESVDLGQIEDSNIDRAGLLPTAQTQPAGSVSFNNYQILLMGVTVGLTDDLQFSGTTMVPLEAGPPPLGIMSMKYRFLRIGRLRAAAQATAVLVRIPDFDFSGGSSRDTVQKFFLASGTASYCLDEKCGSTISASATTGYSPDSEEGDGRGVVYGASVVKQINRRTKALLEFVSASTRSDGTWSHADGGMVSYGLRFFSREISGDVGFIKPFGAADDEDAPVMGVPFFNFTYRAL